MNQFCPNSNSCSDSPIGNFTSEAPDQEVFIARNYGEQLVPPLGLNWTADSCIGTFVSTISQEDANARAQQANITCLSVFWPETDPDPNDPDIPTTTPLTFYESSEQSCNFTCPDGQIFTYTLPAGTVYAFSQASADAQALSIACNRATNRRICIGELSNPACCVGSEYLGTVTFATPQTGPFTVTVVAGELPTGLFLSSIPGGFTISGNPTTAGTYDFTIRVAGENGAIQKSFTMYAVEISPDALTSGEVGVVYNDTVTTIGPTLGTVVWSIVGTIPTGLSFNTANGQFTGTPTVDDTYDFTVVMTDDRVQCSKDYQITIDPVGSCCLVTSASPAVADGPTGCCYAITDNRIFVSLDNGDVVVINAATNLVIATIPAVSTANLEMTYSPVNNRIYCNDFNLNIFTIINPTTMAVIGSIPGPVGSQAINSWGEYDAVNERIYYRSIDGTGDLILSLDPVGASVSILISIPAPVGPASRLIGQKGAYCAIDDNIYWPVGEDDGLGTVELFYRVYTSAGVFVRTVQIANSTAWDGNEKIFFDAANARIYFLGNDAVLDAQGFLAIDPTDDSVLAAVTTISTPWTLAVQTGCSSICILNTRCEQYNVNDFSFVCSPVINTGFGNVSQFPLANDAIYAPDLNALTVDVLTTPP